MSGPEAIATQPAQLEAAQINWALNLKRMAVGAGTVAMAFMGMEGNGSAHDATQHVTAVESTHHKTMTPRSVEFMILSGAGYHGGSDVMNVSKARMTNRQMYATGTCSKENPDDPFIKTVKDSTDKMYRESCTGQITSLSHKPNTANTYKRSLMRIGIKVADFAHIPKADYTHADKVAANNRVATVSYARPATVSSKSVKTITLRKGKKPVPSYYH